MPERRDTGRRRRRDGAGGAGRGDIAGAVGAAACRASTSRPLTPHTLSRLGNAPGVKAVEVAGSGRGGGLEVCRVEARRVPAPAGGCRLA